MSCCSILPQLGHRFVFGWVSAGAGCALCTAALVAAGAGATALAATWGVVLLGALAGVLFFAGTVVLLCKKSQMPPMTAETKPQKMSSPSHKKTASTPPTKRIHGIHFTLTIITKFSFKPLLESFPVKTAPPPQYKLAYPLALSFHTGTIACHIPVLPGPLAPCDYGAFY